MRFGFKNSHPEYTAYSKPPPMVTLWYTVCGTLYNNRTFKVALKLIQYLEVAALQERLNPAYIDVRCVYYVHDNSQPTLAVRTTGK